ncbi:GDP-mannose 4,6-dehydratase [bacterium]|nr:GDP-mannose 4,6-dehydratase [bacterium]
MRALVTGIDGFAGRHLATRLRAGGADVHGTVRRADRVPALAGLAAASLRPLDVSDGGAVAAIVAAVTPEVVFHLAARTFVPDAAADPAGVFTVNALGVVHLLAAIHRHAPRCRVLVVGSSDSYGAVADDAQPIVESVPLRPLSAYGASKAAAEVVAGQWADGMGLDVVRVRPFNHIGPGQDARFVSADFARQLLAVARGAAPPRIEVGDLDPVRDFSDVRDVVDAYVAIAERGRRGAVYNVCSGVGRSIRSLLDDLIAAVGVSVEIVAAADRQRRSPVARLVGSPAALRAATGWQPRIAWQRTIADIVAANRI